MRTTLFAVIGLTATFGVMAQQTVRQPVGEIGAVAGTDSVATFKVNAPNAMEVKVGGAFSKKVPANMEVKDGSYLFEFRNLEPDLYDYWFEIDGQKVLDSSNPYVSRDIASLSNILIVPGGVADWFLPSDVPHGSVHKVWYDSDLLGGSRRITVYTPAGYESSDESYPVLYLLHGMGGDEEAWQDLGRAVQILDNQIAAGITEPMIVVMPNGNAKLKAAPGYTGAGLYMPTGEQSVDPAREFEKSFPEIMEFVERNYRTLPEKRNRAIAGLSMGGGHSWRISMENPELFDYVGLFSPAVRWNGTGVNEDNDPELTEKIKRQFQNPPAFYLIAIGEDDFLLPLNDDYRRLLDSNGISYEYWQSEGGHEWKNWRRYLAEFLPRLFRNQENR